MEVSIARVQESAMLVATWSERGQRRAGFDRLFALGEAGVGLPFMASAQIGVRGGGGGAVSRSRAHEDRPWSRHPGGSGWVALIHHRSDRS